MPHRPRKRFGQNFLRDRGTIGRIIGAVAPVRGDHVVEIGPGLGALTGPLIERLGHLDVVELDRDLIEPLRQRYAQAGDLCIHNTDALRFDFCSLAKPGERLRIVGNLPYNISTPLLFHLMEQLRCIRDMHFMLQKEVVQRLAASPGGREYGRLSVMIQFHCRVQSLLKVPPGAFRPEPKVDSAVVRLIPHQEPPVVVEDRRAFAEVVAYAFAQRRKTLRNTLRGLLDAEEITASDIDARRRAETLTLEEFAALANTLTRRRRVGCARGAP